MGFCLTPLFLLPHPSHRVNVGCGPAEERVLLTGLHAVADIYCENCKTTLGWKYVSTEGSGWWRACHKETNWESDTGMQSPTCFPSWDCLQRGWETEFQEQFLAHMHPLFIDSPLFLLSPSPAPDTYRRTVTHLQCSNSGKWSCSVLSNSLQPRGL